SDALRARGYAVADVPPSLLVARVAVQRPALILIDIDSMGASAVVGRLRQMPDAEGIPLLFIAEPDGNPDELDALRRQGHEAFTRPLDIRQVVRAIEQLLGPPSALRRPRPTGPASVRSSANPLSGLPDDFRHAPRLPTAVHPSGAAQLSPELSAL